MHKLSEVESVMEGTQVLITGQFVPLSSSSMSNWMPAAMPSTSTDIDAS